MSSTGHDVQTGQDADSVAFSPDGRTLAAGTDAGTVVLWDAANRTRLASLSAGATTASTASRSVPTAAPSPPAPTPGRCVLWDAANHTQLASLSAGANNTRRQRRVQSRRPHPRRRHRQRDGAAVGHRQPHPARLALSRREQHRRQRRVQSRRPHARRRHRRRDGAAVEHRQPHPARLALSRHEQQRRQRRVQSRRPHARRRHRRRDGAAVGHRQPHPARRRSQPAPTTPSTASRSVPTAARSPPVPPTRDGAAVGHRQPHPARLALSRHEQHASTASRSVPTAARSPPAPSPGRCCCGTPPSAPPTTRYRCGATLLHYETRYAGSCPAVSLQPFGRRTRQPSGTETPAARTDVWSLRGDRKTDRYPHCVTTWLSPRARLKSSRSRGRRLCRREASVTPREVYSPLTRQAPHFPRPRETNSSEAPARQSHALLLRRLFDPLDHRPRAISLSSPLEARGMPQSLLVKRLDQVTVQVLHVAKPRHSAFILSLGLHAVAPRRKDIVTYAVERERLVGP